MHKHVFSYVGVILLFKAALCKKHVRKKCIIGKPFGLPERTLI